VGAVDHIYEELAHVAAEASDDAGALTSAVLALIAESLSLDVAFLSHIEDDLFTLEKVYDRVGLGLKEGVAMQLCDTYRHKTLSSERQYLAIDTITSVPDLAAMAATQELGLKSYCGVVVRRRDGRVYGTLCTLQRSVRHASAQEIAMLRLAARLIIQAIESDEVRIREQALTKEAAVFTQRFAALFEHASDLVCVIDQKGAIHYASPSFDHVLGYAPETLEGTPMLDLIHPNDHETAYDAFAGVLEGVKEGFNVDVRLRRHDGCWRTVEARGRSLRDNPSVGGVVLNVRDITERVELTQRLRHQTMHDALTGLPNRLMLRERTQAASMVKSAHHCLLLIDLDGFRSVNDTFGHDQGDQLLIEVGGRLRRIMRKADTVARLGGDEFAILVTHADRDAALAVAHKVLTALRIPIVLGERVARISASIGIATSPEHGVDLDVLLGAADLAMYAAKRSGIGCRVYEAVQAEGDADHAAPPSADAVFNPRVSRSTEPLTHEDEQIAWSSLVDPDEKTTRARSHLHLLKARPGHSV